MKTAAKKQLCSDCDREATYTCREHLQTYCTEHASKYNYECPSYYIPPLVLIKTVEIENEIKQLNKI